MVASKDQKADWTTASETESREDKLQRFATTPIDQVLQVDVDVDDEVNYSLLHNDRPLLNTLTLTRLVKDARRHQRAGGAEPGRAELSVPLHRNRPR